MKARDYLLVAALVGATVLGDIYAGAWARSRQQATKQAHPKCFCDTTTGLRCHCGSSCGCNLKPAKPHSDTIVTRDYDYKDAQFWKDPLPPMVAPTKRDVVTHSTELACPKGYEMGQLDWSEEKTIGSWWTFPVCVTPAFIEELRKAAADK